MTCKELPAGLHGALRQSSASSIGSLIILFGFVEEWHWIDKLVASHSGSNIDSVAY